MSDELLERLSRLPGYTIERELGGAGMSRVFLGHETSLDRRVAIKVLEAQGARVDAERFRQEVLLAARLNHPHIVPLLTAGEVDGAPYFIMPFVDGSSLRGRLREGAQPIGESIRLLRNVMAALAYAHTNGVVHRDIKPDNVMVIGGVAVVLDFGVSKALAASSAGARDGITGAGLALGTPRYMAPEQVVADPEIDGRADLYAWGVMAYEMLTGNTPFGGTDPVMILRAHLTTEAPPIMTVRRETPPAIASLIMRCLEKDRTRRPASAGEVLDLLDAMGTPSGTRTGAGMPLTTWQRSKAALIPAVFYVVACGLMVTGLQWLLQQGQIGMRLMVMAVVVALLGLPVVVGIGLVRGIREG